MPRIFLAPAVVAAVLSAGSGTALLVVAIVNAVLAFFAINTMLNLGTQLETGTMIDAWGTYKAVAGAVWTVTFLVAIALIIAAVA